MRELITASSIASTIRMLRAAFSGSFLLVEGDQDVRLLKRFVDATACQVHVCHNRANVISAVEILDANSFIGHLGIIDKDFSEIIGDDYVSENLILTDENDIEVMIFQSDVFDRFLAEFGSPHKVATIENVQKLALREIILDSARYLGILRVLSRAKKWNLRFDGMTIRYLGHRDLQIDTKRQIEHLRGRSVGTSMPASKEVLGEIEIAFVRYPDVIKCVNGHDLCDIVLKGVHDVFGRAHVGLGRHASAVGEIFRTAFTRQNLEATLLFRLIRAWEMKRSPMRIF